MDTSGKFRRNRVRRNRQGFTLVELLTVIVIIGILAGLITAAAIMARAAVKRTVVLSEIAQLDIALQRYKTEFGEYPPDFTGLNQDEDPLVDTAGETAAKAVLNRHLKKRFPRFTGGWDAAEAAIQANYPVDASKLDSASALAFWLGGLPETAGSTRPAGFHEDRANPFKPGLPRTQPLYEFGDDKERFTYFTPPVAPATRPALRCYYFPKGIKDKPYVYFRPQRDRGRAPTYWFVEKDLTPATTQDLAIVRTWPPVLLTAVPGTPADLAVPYLEQTPSGVAWPAEDKYQIVSAGMDGLFGTRVTPAPVTIIPVTSPLTTLPGYAYPRTKTGADFAEGDFDNLTSVYEGKLEDGIE